MQHLGFRLNVAILALASGIFVAACSSSNSNSNSSNSGVIDCNSGAVPKFSELSGLSKCTSCHSSTLSGAERADAPGDVNFDTYAAAREEAVEAVEELETDSMPPAGSPELTSAEIEAIRRWSACGTPE